MALMNVRRILTLLFLLLGGGLIFVACTPLRNFTTYFNLFYNMERIMGEVEEELLYIREQKTPEPTFYIPYDDLDSRGTGYFDHLERRSMTNDEMRANKVKLDSILLKGSSLLAFKNKSDYVDDAIFYIGKTYFYEREWYQSQRKCEELIANFPQSKWSPDAHLLLSMDMMQQGNLDGATTMLSRTIDIAWGRKRLDVLVEAFRLNADIKIASGETQEALRPYYRAMLLSDNNEDRARWEYEIGMISFRTLDFANAIEKFDSVGEYSPDILTQFQTGMQRAAALRALAKYAPASDQLDKLGSNTNFEPWWGMVAMERANFASAQSGSQASADSILAGLDTNAAGYSTYIVYERGVRAFRSGDYKNALDNFSKAQTATAPFQRRARRYAVSLTQYFDQTNRAHLLGDTYQPSSQPDSVRRAIADAYYNTARVFVGLEIPDSVVNYYTLSGVWAPDGSFEAARVFYARAALARASGHVAEADSLLDIIVNDSAYSLTVFASDARRQLNYTENAKVDPAEELYLSGKQFMTVGDNSRALNQFARVYTGYPQSSFAPLALYAAGLIYERRLANADSAYYYYGKIVVTYPESEQAAEVRPLIEAYNLKRMQSPHGDGDDSTRREGVVLPPTRDGLVPLNDGATRLGGDQGGDPAQMITSPPPANNGESEPVRPREGRNP